MSEEKRDVTAEQLAVETLNKMLDEYRDAWYKDHTAIMIATDYGRTMFVWQAKYADGTTIRQYDEINFMRAIGDPNFIPSIDHIISNREADPERVVEFKLFPIAYVRTRCPWFAHSYRLVIRPEKGERYIFHWCVDHNTTTGQTIKRQVIGIENSGQSTYFVISPSGAMTIAQTEDLSFEGE